ncbi:hypothetical protein L6452_13525 [Arctium lappa]|uniref:Uncharacterized protein n=1 Tax=Arctium lappa TaxID=4217 RepID=A0ACB9CIF1_ARCLA|nr:hypothetical protein L6452_13525 [Arctium lappa]
MLLFSSSPETIFFSVIRDKNNSVVDVVLLSVYFFAVCHVFSEGKKLKYLFGKWTNKNRFSKGLRRPRFNTCLLVHRPWNSD